MRFLYLNRFFAIIIFIGFAIVFGTLLYSNSLVRTLAAEEENRVRLYADVLKYIANEQNTETDFLFNKIIKIDSIRLPVINVPAIITNEELEPIGDNLQLPSSLSDEERKKIVFKELEKMKKYGFEPIPIEYVKDKFNYVFYRESDHLIKLRYYPFVTFGLLLVFIIVLFVLLWIAKRNEQNRVWAGLAKETAHQLGTPISGLIAWIEILKLNENQDVQMAVNEMEKDVQRLTNVAERFSKIGSEPELTLQPIAPVIQAMTDYMNNRFGKSKKVLIQYQCNFSNELSLPFNKILLEWVLENLIKNAIDAFHEGKGTVIIRSQAKNKELVIDVIDNGKGISPQNLKYVFKPGFSTKKRGWGLGLSLAKRIVENYHKGKLFVYQTEINKGTTFRMLLPIQS